PMSPPLPHTPAWADPWAGSIPAGGPSGKSFYPTATITLLQSTQGKLGPADGPLELFVGHCGRTDLAHELALGDRRFERREAQHVEAVQDLPRPLEVGQGILLGLAARGRARLEIGPEARPVGVLGLARVGVPRLAEGVLDQVGA